MAKNKNTSKQNSIKIPVNKQTKKEIDILQSKSPALEKSFWNKPANQFLFVGTIALITFVFFSTCLNNQLTNWDDLGYVIYNQYIKDSSTQGILNIFKLSSTVMGNYHPLTILTYAIEYSYCGLKPWLYHFDSVILHVITTIVVFFFVKLLTKRTIAAIIAALLFGIHPMHVESVAWVAGRKDILYGLFYMLSCICYIYYARTQNNKRFFWYIAVIIFFAISLLSKSVGVTLPVILLLIDYFEKRKINIFLLIEKIPHFALSLLFGLLSITAQKQVGALGTLDVTYTPIERLALGNYALITYIWKAILPIGLCNFYPYPEKVNNALPGIYFIYILFVLAVLFLIWKYARKNTMIIFGFLFFLINIVLLLQFIPVGGCIMSDRYGYIPYLGFFIIIGWSISELFESKNKILLGKIALSLTLIYSIVLGFMTTERCKDWYDSISLWNDEIQKHPDNPVAYYYMGQEYYTRFENTTAMNEKKIYGDSSMYYFKMSEAKKPDYINPIISIAELQRNYGLIDDAKISYFKALKYAKNDVTSLEPIYMGMGVVYCIKKDYDSAAFCFRTGLQLKPINSDGHSNYANFLNIIGKNDSALFEYAVAISQNPDNFIPYENRARILVAKNKYDDALKDYNKVLEMMPDRGETYYLRSQCYWLKGNKVLALKDIEMSKTKGFSQIDPNYYQQLKNQ